MRERYVDFAVFVRWLLTLALLFMAARAGENVWTLVMLFLLMLNSELMAYTRWKDRMRRRLL